MVHNCNSNIILKKQRELAGFTCMDLAQHLETTVSSYCDFENYPDELFAYQPLGTIFELGDFLHFDCLTLFDFSNDNGLVLDENETISDYIKKARLKLGYTLQHVSDDVGLEEFILEKIENEDESIFYIIAIIDLEILCTKLDISFLSIIKFAKSSWPKSQTKLNKKWSRYWR